MNIEDLKAELISCGFSISAEKPIEHGIQIKLSNGATVSHYHSGNIQVQGKPKIKSEVEQALNISSSNTKSSHTPLSNVESKANNKVFVVYGHDKNSRDQLEAMLRRWGLDPLILEQLPSGGQTIIEKLESYTNEAQFAIVLATPDDEGFRAGFESEKAFRARQNVVLELGMLLTKLGREKVAILLKDQTKMERPSDINGLIYLSFNEDIAEIGTALAKELSQQDYSIDIEKL